MEHTVPLSSKRKPAAASTASRQSALAVGLDSLPATRLDQALEALRPFLIRTLEQLVRIPSENLPPNGCELACQRYVTEQLRVLGLAADVYPVADVHGLEAHPAFWPGRNYGNRPNVNAVRRGAGGGRSLILSGHIDTVPAHTPVAWTRPPFGAEIDNGRLYGRGAWDMKAGVAMNLTVLRLLDDARVTLKGDVIFETVVDEEFGGANGTLAARLRGYRADGAIIGEPTSLKICPAQRGGRTLHITLFGDGGILGSGGRSGRVMDQLSYILRRIPEFAGQRERRVSVDPFYANCREPFAVWVTNVSTGQWGWSQPITVPERCNLEIYWQTMPEESGETVESEFFLWWNAIVAQRPELFARNPKVHRPMRWLPGCSILRTSPIVSQFERAVESAGLESVVEGLDAPSDMFVFQKCFAIPALMWGPAGGGAHQPDEYVDLDSLVEATRVLARFVCGWCQVEPVGS